MTLRERTEAALRLQPTDRVPFTCYEGLMPPGAADIEGLGIVRPSGVHAVASPNVTWSTETRKDGWQRQVVETPVGSLEQLSRPESGYGSMWKVEHLVKRPEDYEVLAYLTGDQQVSPSFEGWAQQVADVGERGVLMASLPRAPLQRMWIEYTGIERLSYDLHDCPEAVQRPLDAMMRTSRETAEIIADSPAEFVWLPDNMTGEVVGPELFEQHMAPYYAEIAGILHPKGKRMVCHMDGMMRRLKESVAATDIDIIEAFTPAPDTDMRLDEAREAWPGKALWINFTSSVHLLEPDRIKEVTRDLVEQGTEHPGFAISVTENIPADVGARSLEAIAEALREG